MPSWLTIVIIIGAVGYLIAKRFSGEPLNARDLAGPPLIITGIGVYELTKVDGLGAVDIAWLAASLLIALAFGAVRGATVGIFTKDGVLWQRYTVKTIGVWVLSLVVSGGFGLLAVAGGMHSDAKPLMLSIGVGMLGEMATLGLRAMSTGRPFSPERRDSKAAHRHLVERMQGAARRPDNADSRQSGELDRSPKLSDGIGWLSDVVKSTREDGRRN